MYKAIAFTFLVATAMHAEDFVIKKPTKEGKNSLKMSAADSLQEAVLITPDIIKTVADIQHFGFDRLEDMFDDSFFNGMSKEELAEASSLCEQLHNELQSVLHRLEQQKKKLMVSKNKSVQKK